MTPTLRHRAFTIIELLMVIGIISLLLGILLPSIAKARDTALVLKSKSNLRTLGTAHYAYSADFNDRQWTVSRDDFGQFIGCADYLFKMGCPPVAIAGATAEGQILAWGYLGCDGWPGNCLNWTQLWPNKWPPDPTSAFGSYRYNNVRSFNSYVNGRFYDPVFYAPRDRIALDDAEFGFQEPGEMSPLVNGELSAVLMSYVLSPAAMWSPDTFAPPSRGGFTLSLPGRFRAQAAGAAVYPELKTRLLEHSWLQNAVADVNPSVAGNKTPYFFNHSKTSAPATLFFDGHVDLAGIADAMVADARALSQSGEGLWCRDTPYGEDGYFGALSFDDAHTSFHILTTNGIFGRDISSAE